MSQVVENKEDDDLGHIFWEVEQINRISHLIFVMHFDLCKKRGLIQII